MIRKINYGDEGYPKSLAVKYRPPVFTTEYIVGSSMLDMRDRHKMNDKKPILEFMKSLNREKNSLRGSFLRRHSV